ETEPELFVDRDGECFTGRDGVANTREIEFSTIFSLAVQQRSIIAGNGIEERWPVFFDCAKNFFRYRRPGTQDRRGTDRKWEVQCVSESIGKEELGHAEATIGFTDSEDIPGVEFGAHHHVVMQVHTALGIPGAA